MTQTYTLEERTNHWRECFSLYRNTLEALIDDSARANTEMGVVFCLTDDGEYRIGHMCAGSTCTISLTDCKGACMIGNFHTHPGCGVTKPSSADIINSFESNHAFGAIGTKGDGIRCFYPKINDEFISFVIDRHYLNQTKEEIINELKPIVDALVLREDIRDWHISELRKFLNETWWTRDLETVHGTMKWSAEDIDDEDISDEMLDRINEIDVGRIRAFDIKEKINDRLFYGNADKMYGEITL